MIEQVITTIKKNDVNYSEYITLKNELDKIEKEIKEIYDIYAVDIDDISREEQIRIGIEKQLANYNGLRGLFSRKKKNKIVYDKNEFNKLILLQEKINDKLSDKRFQFFLNLSITFSKEDLLREYFDNDFNSFLIFCNDNLITIDFSDCYSLLESFAGYVNRHSLPQDEDNIAFVRKTSWLPQNDIIDPPTVNIENNDRPISTVHFAISHEVLGHHGASWDNCDYTIIHPLNEGIYQQLVNFNPVDSFAFGSTKLDSNKNSYYIICSSKENSEKIRKNNVGAVPIIVPKEKMAGSGNLFLQAWRYYHHYKEDGGVLSRIDKPMFSENITNKYPRMKNEKLTYQACDTSEHEFGKFALDSKECIKGLIKNDVNIDDKDKIDKILSSIILNVPFWHVMNWLSYGDRLYTALPKEFYGIYKRYFDFLINSGIDFNNFDNIKERVSLAKNNRELFATFFKDLSINDSKASSMMSNIMESIYADLSSLEDVDYSSIYDRRTYEEKLNNLFKNLLISSYEVEKYKANNKEIDNVEVQENENSGFSR